MSSKDTLTSNKRYKTIAIRNLLTSIFDNQSIVVFCYDHYQSVYDHFSDPMSLAEKLEQLMEHCQQQNTLDTLLTDMRKNHPAAYGQYGPYQDDRPVPFPRPNIGDIFSRMKSILSRKPVAWIAVFLVLVISSVAISISRPKSDSITLTIAARTTLPETLYLTPVSAEISSCLQVYALTGDDSGNIWAGTNFGVWRTRADQSLSPYPKPEENLLGHNIYTLFSDNAGRLWAGGDQGLWVYQDNRWQVIPELADNDFADLAGTIGTDKTTLWASTFAGEVIGLNYNPTSISPTALNTFYRERIVEIVEGDTKIDLIVDNKERVWIGTLGQGVGIYDPNAASTQVVWKTESTDQLPDDDIMTLAIDTDNRIWIGTLNGHYGYWDPKTDDWLFFALEEMDAIWTIIAEPGSVTWIGLNRRGLIGHLNEQAQYYPIEDDPTIGDSCPTKGIRALYYDPKQDSLWIGGLNGMRRWTLNN